MKKFFLLTCLTEEKDPKDVKISPIVSSSESDLFGLSQGQIQATGKMIEIYLKKNQEAQK